MLPIPLRPLEREGSLEVRGLVAAEDPIWEGTGLRFAGPVSVSGKVERISSGEILARLRIRRELDQECRRCLEVVRTSVEEELSLLFAPEKEPGDGEDEEIRPLPPGAVELDLREAIREEMVLSRSLFALCKPDCLGLCPRCGVNLNEEPCQCSTEESDPRWDPLRALKNE